MHVRARRALQDTLTAIRVKKPLAECGFALHPNGERHLRSRARLSTIYPAALLAETVAIAQRCRFSLDELRYEYPEEIVPPGGRRHRTCASLPEGLATLSGCTDPARGPRADRARARADLGIEIRALLPHRP
jgi:error-prone DNA polymerase